VSRAGYSKHNRDDIFVRRLAEKKEWTRQRVESKGTWKEYNKTGNKEIKFIRLWIGFIRLNTRSGDRLF
jgi:hypothetical protein